jgi:hypothetical protein
MHSISRRLAHARRQNSLGLRSQVRHCVLLQSTSTEEPEVGDLYCHLALLGVFPRLSLEFFPTSTLSINEIMEKLRDFLQSTFSTSTLQFLGALHQTPPCTRSEG